MFPVLANHEAAALKMFLNLDVAPDYVEFLPQARDGAILIYDYIDGQMWQQDVEAVAKMLGRVDHPRIRALYDYGNSQMVGEEPMDALEAMIEYISSVHVKDHVVLTLNNQDVIQGVPMGQG